MQNFILPFTKIWGWFLTAIWLHVNKELTICICNLLSLTSFVRVCVWWHDLVRQLIHSLYPYLQVVERATWRRCCVILRLTMVGKHHAFIPWMSTSWLKLRRSVVGFFNPHKETGYVWHPFLASMLNVSSYFIWTTLITRNSYYKHRIYFIGWR